MGTLIKIIAWTDTLMLGYFKTPDLVALYNVAQPLAILILTVVNSIGFLYMPMISKLFGEKQTDKLVRNYSITTKWCYIATFPIFLLLFSFPNIVLKTLFTPQYLGAVVVLQILAFKNIINAASGPNYHTLIAFGKNKDIIKISVFGVLINITLNIILIPILGLIGAAIASASASLFINIFLSFRLYKFSKIHPLSKNYFKIILLSISILFLIIIITYIFENITLYSMIFIMIISICTFFTLIIISKSLDKEDIMLLLAIENKLGLNLKRLKKLLKRYI
jgi:O-antigen/teichoic acid export membrane protein